MAALTTLHDHEFSPQAGSGEVRVERQALRFVEEYEENAFFPRDVNLAPMDPWLMFDAPPKARGNVRVRCVTLDPSQDLFLVPFL